MIKILFVITGLNYGGAEMQLVTLATHLQKRGWEVKIASMTTPNQDFLKSQLTSNNLSYASLDMPKGVPDIRAIFKLGKIIKNWQPDIVHSHMIHANLFCRITRLVFKMPVLISTIHNIYEGMNYKDYSKGDWRYSVYRYTNKLSDYTTIISQTAKDIHLKFKAVNPDKFLYIPNGINTDFFYPDKSVYDRLRKEHSLEDKFVWLAVGRIEAAKDYPTLIKAFKQVHQSNPDTVLIMVGEGSLKDSLFNLAQELQINHAIQWLGKRSDVADLMKMADAYVMSSKWEGLPIVLLEALATGLPIVATRVGGNSELVKENKNGFLVSPDNISELTEAMLSMMNLPTTERQNMQLMSREHSIINYDVNKVVSQWEALYKKAL